MNLERLLFKKRKEIVSEEKPGEVFQSEISEQNLNETTDLDKVTMDSRETDLARIDALEEEAGFDLSETKEELSGEIEELGEKVNVEKAKDALARHIGSPEYAGKLAMALGGDKEKAARIQKKRLENLKNTAVEMLPLAELQKEHFRRTREHVRDILRERFGPTPGWLTDIILYKVYADIDKVISGVSKNVRGFYVRKEHKLYAPEDTKDGNNVLQHELLHASTMAHEDIEEKTKRIFDDSFKDTGDRQWDSYLKMYSEMLVRKQRLDLEMEKLGIKKYGDVFTKDHQNKMMEFYGEGKFSEDAATFIETTKPEYFEIIFNEIAKNETERGSDSMVA